MLHGWLYLRARHMRVYPDVTRCRCTLRPFVVACLTTALRFPFGSSRGPQDFVNAAARLLNALLGVVSQKVGFRTASFESESPAAAVATTGSKWVRTLNCDSPPSGVDASRLKAEMETHYSNRCISRSMIQVATWNFAWDHVRRGL